MVAAPNWSLFKCFLLSPFWACHLYQLIILKMWPHLNPFLPSYYPPPLYFWPPPPYLLPPRPPAAPPCPQPPKTKCLGAGVAGASGESGRDCVQSGVRSCGGRREREERRQKLQRQRELEDNFENKKQKKDRNLPSNIFRYFFNFLYAHPHLAPTALALAPHAPPLDLPLFLNKVKSQVKEKQNYIRPGVVQSLCREGVLSSQESLLFRVLLRNFLLRELGVTLAGLQKYKRRQKNELLKMGRKLMNNIKKGAYF